MTSSERGIWIALVGALLMGFLAVSPDGTAQVGGALPSDVVMIDPGSDPLDDTSPGLGQEHPDLGKSQDPAGPGEGNLDPVADRYECRAGRNGGNTDRGVTADEVRLATTVVQDGPAASLLRWSLVGMKAVVDRVNREGGICGRRLSLTTANDSFDAQRGRQYLRNFIEEDYFALPVVPSAEGLGSAILAGEISRAGIPVVGTDGMRAEQYRDPWVWPVASATVSTMRAMAKYAFDHHGVRNFAIVWDSKYQFGKEGAQAFKEQVAGLKGKLVAEASLNPDLNSYASDVQKFNGACESNPCEMVALLLLPDTADTWMQSRPTLGTKYTAGAQTLFTDEFAQKCVNALGHACDGLATWTGYNPAIGRNLGLPDINAYVNEVTAISSGAPVTNQFMHGAYLGMSVFVEALRRVGPNLTRDALRKTLDSMTFKSDLASDLTWKPGKHAASTRARAYSIVYQSGNFQGWRDDQTGFVQDPKGGP